MYLSHSQRRVSGMAHWDQGVDMDDGPSSDAVGSRDTGHVSTMSRFSDVEYLTLTSLMVEDPGRQATEAFNNKKLCGKGLSSWKYLLVGSLVLMAVFLSVTIMLLSLYLQANARLDTVYEETGMLYQNQSHRAEAVDSLKERNLVLQTNLSSLMDALTSLQEHTLPQLLLTQTERLKEIERQKHLYQVEVRNYIELQEVVTRNNLLIPRDSPILQNCENTDQGTVCPFCSADWHFFGLSCYLLSPQPRSWQESLQWCRKQGGHLAVIDSYEEQEFLRNFIKKTSWIGLSDSDMEGQWQWLDGTPYNATPKFWHEKQPDNAGNEDCAVLVPGSMWKDDKCRRMYSSVCEHRAGELQLPEDTISN
ncbi:uncharacterized protein LOC142101710 [Mixophyes fleayi]|uniref:uncharacterized protein LOC142101710 n=1 Tax=Mixophyes fleayi TaxID=3061075 RepID=UPI003F4D836C